MVPMKCPESSYTVTKMWVVQLGGVAIQTLRQQRECGPTPTEQKIGSAVRQDQIFLSVTGQHTSLELNIAWAQCHINTKQHPSSMTQCPSKHDAMTKQHDAMMQHDAMTQHHDAMAQQHDAMTQQHDTMAQQWCNDAATWHMATYSTATRSDATTGWMKCQHQAMSASGNVIATWHHATATWRDAIATWCNATATRCNATVTRGSAVATQHTLS